jgi:F0F1-type ATP synthase assembly protein I
MSDAAPMTLDIREQLARIDRALAETEKLMAENRKLTAESLKLSAERQKFNRDPWILALTALLGIVAAVIARLPEILHAVGVGR